MPRESLIIEITSRGARVVRRDLAGIGASAQDSTDAIDSLKSALAILGIGIIARELIEFADTATLVENRLKLVTDTTAELNAINEELFRISNATRNEYEGVAQVYLRTALASRQLGISQQQLLNFTETLNQAVILSGATAAESTAAMIQLAQGMALGALRGDELRSVGEQLPLVLDVIADHLGVTRDEVRNLGLEGKITSQIIFDAFRDAGDEIANRFAQTVPTVDQAFVVLRNNAVQLVREINQGTGVFRILAELIILAANNLDTLAAAATAAGIALATLYAPQVISGLLNLGGILRGILVAARAHPILALIGIVLGAVAAIATFKRETLIDLGDESVSVGNLMQAAWEEVARAIDFVLDRWNNVLNTIRLLSNLIPDIFPEIRISLVGILQFIATSLDFISNASIAVMRGILVFLEGFLQAARVSVLSFNNFLIDLAEETINGLVQRVNQLPGVLDLALFDFSNLKTEVEGGFGQLGQESAQAFFEGFGQQTFFSDVLNRILERARELASQGEETVDLGATGPTRPVVDEELIKAFEKLRDRIDPTTAAVREFREELNILGQARAAGLIETDEELIRLRELLTRQTEDQREPLHAIVRDLQFERDLIGQSAEEQEILNTLREIRLNAEKAGILITEQQLDQLENELRLNQRLLTEEERRQEVANQFPSLQADLDPITAATIELTQARQLLNEAEAQGIISEDQLVVLTRILEEQYQDILDPLGALNREIERQAELIFLEADALEREHQIIDITNELKNAGVVLTEEQTEALRRQLEELQSLNRQGELYRDILERLHGPQQEFIDGLEAINRLLEEGKITLEEATRLWMDFRIQVLEANEDATSGFERGILKLFRDWMDVASEAEDVIVGIFRNMEDALAEFVATGKFDFNSLIESFIRDLTRLAAQQVFLQIFGGGGAGGGSLLESIVGGIVGVFGGGGVGASTTLPTSTDPFGNLPTFQHGGRFTVPGTGGIDSQLVAFRATPGEEVQVQTPNQSRTNADGFIQNITLNMNISTQDADSFGKSRGQIFGQAELMLRRAGARNN